MSDQTDHDDAACDQAAANTDEEKNHDSEKSDKEDPNSGCFNLFLELCILWALLERACSG